MSYPTPATAERDNADRIEDLADQLRTHQGVTAVNVGSDRRPIQLVITTNTQSIPGGVRDVMDEAGIIITDANVTASGGLRLTTIVQMEYDHIATYQVRPHGNSYVVTLPKKEMPDYGISNRDLVDIYGRPGEFRIVKR